MANAGRTKSKKNINLYFGVRRSSLRLYKMQIGIAKQSTLGMKYTVLSFAFYEKSAFICYYGNFMPLAWIIWFSLLEIRFWVFSWNFTS